MSRFFLIAVLAVLGTVAVARPQARLEALFEDWKPMDGGWLETKCSFYFNGKLAQVENDPTKCRIFIHARKANTRQAPATPSRSHHLLHRLRRSIRARTALLSRR